MATLSISVLEDALRNGEIDGRGYHPMAQVQTMNHILSRIRAGKVDSFTLHEYFGLHHCTVLIYCRWLSRQGLIQIVHKGQGGVCWYEVC